MYKGNLVTLRGYKKEDINKALEYINDLECKKLLVTNAPFPTTLKEEEKWIEGIEANSKLTYDFAIEANDTLEYIGGCSINETDLKNRNCTIGIMIGNKDYWGKGYGTDALKVLVKFIFDELNMHKVKLCVFSFNKRAIACYKKVGFIEEGRLRDEVYRDGKYHDDLIMSILKDEYYKR